MYTQYTAVKHCVIIHTVHTVSTVALTSKGKQQKCKLKE